MILLGTGIGWAFQTAIVVAQTTLTGTDVSIGTSAMVLGQTLGGAVILSVAQNVFQSTLIAELASRAPQVPVGIVTSVGAAKAGSALTALLGADLAGVVVLCYNLALRRVWIVVLVLSCVSIFGAIGMEWKSVKAAKEAEGAGGKGNV